MGTDAALLQAIFEELSKIRDQLATLTALTQQRAGQVADDAVAPSTRRSRLLTAEEVARELRFERTDLATGETRLNMKAFYAWRYRYRSKLPAVKRGRTLLFLRSDVELCARDEAEHVRRLRQPVRRHR